MKINGTERGNLWSIILAGGEGERTRPLVTRWLGYHKPKQFCTFVGRRSMLQHTWDRADQLTLPERKVTVVSWAHRREVWQQVENRNVGHVVLQPQNRDTAAGIFLPLTYVRAWDPGATVVVFPSDHFVFPENQFVQTVRHAVLAAERLADRVILVGVTPRSLELEYGWIQPAQELGWFAGSRFRAVDSFLEKPDASNCMAAMAAGALWNTLVVGAKVETLWNLGWRCLLELMDLFEVLGQTIGFREEGNMLDSIYRVMPVVNFSSDLLQRVTDRLGVIELRDAIWSDWGQPERIVETLRALGEKPAFPLNFQEGSSLST